MPLIDPLRLGIVIPFGLAVLAAGAAVVAGGTAAEPPAPLPETVSVTAWIKMGEPGAPAEQVTVSRAKGVSKITVEQTPAKAGAKSVTATAEITDEEFAAVWSVGGDLRTFLPKPEADHTDDFGTRRVRVEWQFKTDPQLQIHDVSWANEIKNRGPAEKLHKELGRLAAKHLKEPKLLTFPAQ